MYRLLGAQYFFFRRRMSARTAPGWCSPQLHATLLRPHAREQVAAAKVGSVCAVRVAFLWRGRGRKQTQTTLNGGSLGSCVDEERS
ncbi:hypothetical protein chiPu_0022655 [Chiloscyllium punctatum]|uniref:Uncharacterized protein n=1 Tax=Chiloscyllium punctatum TaxID=137246 RepID=A0A401RJ93_CHIPU|nr:hypothetical protein [Chiloscyllium punctatum]